MVITDGSPFQMCFDQLLGFCHRISMHKAEPRRKVQDRCDHMMLSRKQLQHAH